MDSRKTDYNNPDCRVYLNYPRWYFLRWKRRFILLSALAGIVIWFSTFFILVGFTELPIIFNKLICILAVLTFWLIRWYKGVRQYLIDSKRETRALLRLKAMLKYGISEVFHFIILISVLWIIMIFIEKYY
jgi:hypothetical protein